MKKVLRILIFPFRLFGLMLIVLFVIPILFGEFLFLGLKKTTQETLPQIGGELRMAVIESYSGNVYLQDDDSYDTAEFTSHGSASTIIIKRAIKILIK